MRRQRVSFPDLWCCHHSNTFAMMFNLRGVQPRKDGLGTPPFLEFFYSYTLRRHPKTLNTNTAPSMRLLWGTLGLGLVMPNFGVFLETPFWAGTPPFLYPFVGRNPPS